MATKKGYGSSMGGYGSSKASPSSGLGDMPRSKPAAPSKPNNLNGGGGSMKHFPGHRKSRKV